MASRPLRRVALLSIRPSYAESIINGHKRVEFRRVRFSSDVQYVVIYVTKPIQGIMGYFEVDRIHEDTPEALWPRHCANGGISHEEFEKYYSGSRRGVAIEVGKVYSMEGPLSLSSVGASTPPRSFFYVADDVFDGLLRLSKPSLCHNTSRC
ncbi:MAG: ASCH domain-containing protein [Chloroflexi bacterium]|nr:ASCH domain-containing protein [Chloroflexota bacterium]